MEDAPRGPHQVISFSKSITFFGIADIHDFHPGLLFYFNGLGKNEVLNARQNYKILLKTLIEFGI